MPMPMRRSTVSSRRVSRWNITRHSSIERQLGEMMRNGVDQVIAPPVRDLGDGFRVRRALPAGARQMVGPFIFFDEMGPVVLGPGHGLDVRPHPHIGLATVTYLFEGEILHRDSLGTVQAIRPGEVNWMTAGRGIVHSERTPPELRAGEKALAGIQAWIALHRQAEECEPAFLHLDAGQLPAFRAEGIHLRVIAGSIHGEHAPETIARDAFYADVMLDAGARLPLEARYEERAAYLVEGRVQVLPGGTAYEAGQLIVFRPGADVTLAASGTGRTRFMLLGGARVPERRYIWWNFVSSSPERIDQAKEDWREGRFASVPGDPEFIPLPEQTPPGVDYP
jgi:redox-sensitive bicupin YhaK (pirin superfamily)